jgi:CheY-like chemotaxis protein
MASLPRILLVEDNPGDVELLRQAFEEARHTIEIVAASDGRRAMRLLNEAAALPEQPYGIIILDLQVPFINGLELLKRIKGDERLKNVPTVVLTSSSNPADREQSQALQPSAYLIKPQSIGDYAAITRVLWSHLEHPRTT